MSIDVPNPQANLQAVSEAHLMPPCPLFDHADRALRQPRPRGLLLLRPAPQTPAPAHALPNGLKCWRWRRCSVRRRYTLSHISPPST